MPGARHRGQVPSSAVDSDDLSATTPGSSHRRNRARGRRNGLKRVNRHLRIFSSDSESDGDSGALKANATPSSMRNGKPTASSKSSATSLARAFTLSDDEDGSDDDIVFLKSPPPHMMPQDNREAPIEISDDEDNASPLPRNIMPIWDDELGKFIDANGQQLVVNNERAHLGVIGSVRDSNPGPIDSESERDLPRAKRVRIRAPDNAGEAGPSTASSSMILPKADYLVPLVLAIIPDLDADWATSKLDELITGLKDSSAAPGQEAVERVVDMAFEMEGGYPKATALVPGPVAEQDDDYKDPAFRSERRRGPAYDLHAQQTLFNTFKRIPSSHVRDVYKGDGKGQLVPTYLILHRQSTAVNKPYTELKRNRGKGPVLFVPDESELDENEKAEIEEAAREGRYLQKLISDKLAKEALELQNQKAHEVDQAKKKERQVAAIACGLAVECGCCFDSYAPEDTVECETGHGFCCECVAEYANTKLGERATTMRCMDTSGCTEEFTEHTLRKVLPEKTMSLYHRIRQAADLEAAQIDGLESCPFCPFAMVIENVHERLFTCFNPECKKVTCRQCKRLDHLPRRCDEMSADEKLDKRHAIEEAMSAALVRKCPKCSQPFIKDFGCNKMTCRCGATCCYICGKAVKGYEHFQQQQGPPPGQPRDHNVCYLYSGNDAEDEMQRVRAAREKAQQEVMQNAATEGVQLNEQDVSVELPPVAAAAAPGAYAMNAARAQQQAQYFAFMQLRGQVALPPGQLGRVGVAVQHHHHQHLAVQAAQQAHVALQAGRDPRNAGNMAHHLGFVRQQALNPQNPLPPMDPRQARLMAGMAMQNARRQAYQARDHAHHEAAVAFQRAQLAQVPNVQAMRANMVQLLPNHMPGGPVQRNNAAPVRRGRERQP